MSNATNSDPVLLCFDGSDDAAHAIASAGRLFGARRAVVITVSEPIRTWQPSDPATILDAGIGRLLAKALELEQIADEVTQMQLKRGVELARGAGFRAEGRMTHGKPWRAICDQANELNAAVIVLGARGLSRVESMLLGSVSAAVSVHAGRPVLIVHRAAPTIPATNARRQGQAHAAGSKAIQL